MLDPSLTADPRRTSLLEQIAFHERSIVTLRALLAGSVTVTVPPTPSPLPALTDDFVEVSRIAPLVRRTESTIRRWCVDHQLGQLVGGRWYVSRSRLEAFLACDGLSGRRR